MKTVNLRMYEKGGSDIATPFESQKRCRSCHKLFEPRFKMERLCSGCKKPGGEMNLFLDYTNPVVVPKEKFKPNLLVA